MEKYFKIIVGVASIISIILLIKLAYFIFKPEDLVKITVGKLQEKQVVKEMDTKIENYNCQKFTDITSGTLTYCERKVQNPVEIGVPTVRGYYIRDTATIWIDKNQSNDTILHELFHWADINFIGQGSETRAYAFQEMYTQLVAKKIIK
jgi:hypothetical protein